MSIGQVLVILWRRSWIAALTFLTALAVALAVLWTVPGRYDAVSTASIDPSGLDPVSFGSTSAASINLMQGNMLQLVNSQRVAEDVVRRLNLTANPRVQAQYRASDSFGRESIDEWMASSISKNVDPKFSMGTNVLSIKYKSGDPNQAALIANAFLAATIDATIAMKAASADQTARWFAPQLDELRKDFQSARSALEAYQSQTNIAVPAGGQDTESSQLNSVTADLNNAKTSLTALQSRLASGTTNLSTDPSDPDLQMVADLKARLTAAQTAYESVRTTLGANNPKMQAEAANIAATRKQLSDATDKMRQHLKDRIAQTEDLITTLEAEQAEAQKTLIAAQARRGRLGELQRDAGFKLEQLNERQRTAEQAKLASKLTFAAISVLDKAVPPISPAFPKPLQVILVAIGAGLSLGIILSLIAEMIDRRVRAPADLAFASSAPLLGIISASRRSSPRLSRSQQRLRPA